jgi:hypothetical protein
LKLKEKILYIQLHVQLFSIRHAASLSLLEMFGFSVPLALLGSYLFGTTGIFTAIAFSYLATGIVSFLVLGRVLKLYPR